MRCCQRAGVPAKRDPCKWADQLAHFVHDRLPYRSVFLWHNVRCMPDDCMGNEQMSASELARKYTDRAIEVVAEIMEGGEDKDRLKAAETLLDRGHGKAAQAIIAVPPSRQQQALLAAFSDDELMAVLSAAKLPKLAPIEAEFTDIDPLLG